MGTTKREPEILVEHFEAHENCPINAFLFELASAFHKLEQRTDLTINIVQCTIDRVPMGDRQWKYSLRIRA
jgi:hypothetical protein